MLGDNVLVVDCIGQTISSPITVCGDQIEPRVIESMLLNGYSYVEVDSCD